ncbi:MAG: hypothetical protein WCA46_27595 [Actinocatenispora sp.]
MQAPSAYASPGSGDAARHLVKRVYELDRVLEGAAAEREMAQFLAYRSGLSVREIAGLLKAGVEDVQALVDGFAGDEEADTYQEGPRWVEVWPKQGWSVTR